MSNIKSFFERPETITLTLILFFGFVSIFVMPLEQAADEDAHFIKSYQISELKLFPDERIDNNDGSWTAGYYLPAAVLDNPARFIGFQSNDNNNTQSGLFDQRLDLNERVLSGIAPAEAYFPTSHFPQAIGIALGRLIYPSFGFMYLFGRLINLLFYGLSMFFIIRNTAVGKWAFAVLALFPMALSSAASYSADSVAMVSTFCFYVVYLNLLASNKKVRKYQLVLIVTSAIVMCGTRPTNVALLLPILFLPSSAFSATSTDSYALSSQPERWASIKKWLFILLGGAFILTLIISWQCFQGTLSAGLDSYADGINPSQQLQKIAGDPLSYFIVMLRTVFRYGVGLLKGIVGSFSWLTYAAPPAIIVLEYALLCLALARRKQQSMQDERLSTKYAILLLCTFLVNVAGVFTALFVTWTPIELDVIVGIQGRYFLPSLALLIPLGYLLPKKYKLSPPKDYQMGILMAGVACISLSTYLIQTFLFFW